MAEERVIRIVADTSDANKKVKTLGEDLEKVETTAKGVGEETVKATGNVGKSSQTATKKVGLLSNGFRGLGTAIKATGIGLVVSAIAALGVAFSKNQRFMDAFSTATETLSIVMAQITDALFNVYDAVSKNSENFDALKKVLQSLLTLAVTPLKLAFFGIKLAIQEAQLVWERSFFGGQDNKKIAELNLAIIETKSAIFDVGKEAINAGKTYIKNIGEAITETVNIGSKAVEELSKISIKSAFETAKVNVAIKNSALLAAAEQGRLIEIYDRLAEKQRQVRDDESMSIAERKKANDELGKILEKQEKALLAQANLQIQAAQVEVNKNKTIENQVALTEALANREGVLAQIEGFRSEQLVNRIALINEENELQNILASSEKERRLAQLDFEASREKDAILRLEKEKERLDLENEIILEDLERKRELYKEGTLSRTEAEQEYLSSKQEIDNKILENESKKEDEKKKSAEALENFKASLAQGGLNLLGALAKRGSAIAKGVAIAQAGISTYQGINKALAETTDFTPTQSLRFANAALVGVAGFANIANILKTNEMGQGGFGASANNAQPQTSAPSFNLVQGTGSNQVAETINQNQRPIQAFVVGSNVTSQQELDRRRVANSTL
jgi:hypothetical protein